MDIISRYDALQSGRTRYFTGEPCKRGHVCERYCRNSACLECMTGRPQPNDMRGRNASIEAHPRRRAIRTQQLKYFTGKPCNNGHIAHRYTLSGACVECVHPSFRVNKLLEMVDVYYAIHPADMDLFTAVAYSKLLAREPHAQLTEVHSTRKCPNPSLAGFRCYPEDREVLNHLSLTLQWPRLSPEQQASIRAAQSLRKDGWEPPAL